MLAGDLYGKTPIRVPLLIFKGLYYAGSLLHPVRTLRAWQARRHNIRDADETGATVN